MTVLVELSLNACVISAFQCQDLKERELGADKDGKLSKGWKMLERCCTCTYICTLYDTSV